MTETVINMASALEERITDAEQRLHDAITARADIKLITTLTRELTSLRKTHSSVAKMAPQEDDTDHAQAAQDLEILKADIRMNILNEFDYYYVNDQEKFVLYTEADNTWTIRS